MTTWRLITSRTGNTIYGFLFLSSERIHFYSSQPLPSLKTLLLSLHHYSLCDCMPLGLLGTLCYTVKPFTVCAASAANSWSGYTWTHPWTYCTRKQKVGAQLDLNHHWKSALQSEYKHKYRKRSNTGSESGTCGGRVFKYDSASVMEVR